MYRKYVDDGKVVEVEGLTCHLPPEGYILDPITGKLVFIDVAGDGLPYHKQYWRRPKLPDDYEARLAEMERQRKHTPNYVDPVVASVRRREWLRRLGGYWFMNGGKPTYITGLHYFYLTYYQLDNRYPMFRIPDMETFYMWDYICDDPRSMGLMLLTRRRYGKTFIGGAILLEYATRAMRASCGIQSKDEDTAEKAFHNAVMMPFKKLPDFFRPRWDGRSTRRLSFAQLGTTVDYRAVGEVAYDGWKLQRYLCDEFGKTKGADIVARHNVIKYCLMEVPKIIGKAFYCTTVEEMSGGDTVRQVVDMWEGSNQYEGRAANGRTDTGLYRRLIPASRSMNFNRFGYPDENRNMKFIMATRSQALKRGDQALYMAEVRKMPNSFNEAVMSTASEGAFSNLIVSLAEQLELLKSGIYKDKVVRGMFRWTEDKDSPVVFVPSRDGPWEVLVEYTDPARAQHVRFVPNRVTKVDNFIFPENKEAFGIGVDPYSKRQVTWRTGSKGAIAVFRQFDPVDVQHSDMFVAMYCHRPNTLTAFYEEVLKACWYFGSQFLHEDNVSGIEEYALTRGYSRFIYHVPGRTTGGITSNVRSKPRMVSFMEGYIEECVEKIFFPSLIEDLMAYDIENSHPYDIAAASMIALLMCHRSRSNGIGMWGSVKDGSDYSNAIYGMPDISIFK